MLLHKEIENIFSEHERKVRSETIRECIKLCDDECDNISPELHLSDRLLRRDAILGVKDKLIKFWEK